jgi:hypothetical protein
LVTASNNTNTSTINLGFASVTLIDDNLINTHITIKDAVTLDQAKLLLEAYLKIGKGNKIPHLFTTTKFVIMEKEVMEFMSSQANKYGKADAFVIHSLPQKIIGDFYLRFHKPSIPTKLFKSKAKAIAWLKTF